MKNTYVIEDGPNVVEYFGRLSDAQRFLVKNFDKPWTLLCLKGHTFGEGYHAYRMILNRHTLKFNYTHRRYNGILIDSRN